MSDGTIKILTDLSTEGFEKGISKLGSLTKTGFAVVGTAITATSAALVGLGGYAVKVGSSFEAGMSEVGAISGATGKDLEALTAKAKEMGSTTKFSATESAEALKYMAMAGWDTDKMLSGLPGIMNLAAASGENLGLVSDIVTDSMTAFGLSADKAGRFADVLAQASNKSNTSVGLMGETFKYVAPVAGALGYSVEDTAVAIGLMANSGIKGSQAGTALRSTLSRLAKPTDEVQEAMDDLGISLTDSEGNMKAFEDVVGDMRTGFKGLTKEQQAQYAASIAGQEGMSGLLAIVNASDDDFNALTEAINNADGAAEAVAKTMQDNLQGSITIAKSALEGLGITVYEQIEAPLKSAVEAGTGYINELNEAFSHGLDSGVESLGGIFADIAVKAAESAPKMIESGKNVLLAFCDGIEKNSKEIAKSAIKIGKELIKAFAELIPQIGKIGLKIITEFAKELFGYDIGKEVDALGKTIETSFNKIVDSVKNAIDTLSPVISRLTKVFLDVANAGVKILADAISFLCDNINIVLPVIAAVAGAVVAYNIAVGLATTGVQLVTAAQWLWNAAMVANPIGLAVIAVGALVGGIAALTFILGSQLTAEEQLSEANMALGDTYSDALGKIGEYQKGVDGAKGILDALNQSTGLTAEKQQELSGEMSSVQQEINAICSTASSERRQLTDEEIASLETLIQKQADIAKRESELYQGRADSVKVYAEQVSTSSQYTAEEFKSEAQSVAKSAKDSCDQRINYANELMIQQLAQLDQEAKVSEEVRAEYNERKEDIISAYQEEKTAAQVQMDETNAILADGYAARATNAQNWVDRSREFNAAEILAKQSRDDAILAAEYEYNQISDKNSTEAINALEKAENEKKRIENKYASDIAEIRSKKNDTLKNISTDEIATLMDMVNQAGGCYDNLNGETKEMVGQFLKDIGSLDEPTRIAMNETLNGMGLEITKGGDLMKINADGSMTKFITGFTSRERDAVTAMETTLASMNTKSKNTTYDAGRMGRIQGGTASATEAIDEIQGYYNSHPTYVTTYTRNVNISGNRDTSTWAKGGVTGYASGGVTKYAKGGVAPKIAKHAAGVFTKRTRLWDPVTGINEYGEAGHEALLPLKESVFNEIARGIVRQLSPAKVAGMMSQLKAAVQGEASSVSMQITAKSDLSANYGSQEKSSRILDSMLQKMDAMIEKLEAFANLTVLMDGEKVGKLVTAPVNAGLGDIYNMEERGKF